MEYRNNELNQILNGKIDAYLRAGKTMEDLYIELELKSSRHFDKMRNGEILASSNFINKINLINNKND